MTFALRILKGRRLRGTTRAVLTLAGVLGFSVLATQMSGGTVAHAAPGLRYQRGYSVQGSWLCYGWTNGAYHCTQHWHRAGSRLVSDNPGWVPNYGMATYSSGTRPVTVHTAAHTSHGTSKPATTTFAAAPGRIGQWNSTGIRAYGMADFAGDPYHGYFGACTWYAWYRHQNEPLMQLGNAASWAYTARAHGLSVGSTPRVGATVVFQPGVQGASPAGHVAHVEAVYGNGWFLVSEMSFYWNGGGWGRVSYRYAHVGAGVSFIY